MTARTPRSGSKTVAKTVKKPVIARKKAERPVIAPAKVSARSAQKRAPAKKPAPPAPLPTRRPRAKTAQPRPPAPKQGSLERAVRKDLASVADESPVHTSLVQLAISLARQLDAGAGMAAAAIGRELRNTLNQLTEAEEDKDDELDQFVNGLGLPPTVVDAAQTGPADDRNKASRGRSRNR
jgi:hypothetical protein